MAARVLFAALLGGAIVCASSLALPRDSAAEEKKRVPKPQPEETRRKGEEPKKEEKEKNEGGGFADCLGNIFMDMICSGSERESEAANTPQPPRPPEPGLAPAQPPATVAGAAPPAQAHTWQPGDEAVVLVSGTSGAEVQLWNGPGGSAAGYTQTRRVRDGTHARVVETGTSMDKTWLRITTLEKEPVMGWLPEADAAWLPPKATASSPLPESAATGLPPEPGHAGPAGLVLLANASWPAVTGPFEAREEYRDGGWRFGLNAFYVTRSTLQFGLGAGYLRMRGYPKYAYQTSTMTDDPRRSHHQVFDAGLRAGQYLGALGGRVYWAAGPVLYWVKESAEITVRDTSWAAVGTRTESLERVRVGADLTASMAWPLGSSLRVGAFGRLYAIPWFSRASKSLTFDFIGDKTLVGVEVGLAVGFEP